MIANVVQWWLLTGVIVVGAHTYILHTHTHIYIYISNIIEYRYKELVTSMIL